jgi:hypothetical protein
MAYTVPIFSLAMISLWFAEHWLRRFGIDLPYRIGPLTTISLLLIGILLLGVWKGTLVKPVVRYGRERAMNAFGRTDIGQRLNSWLNHGEADKVPEVAMVDKRASEPAGQQPISESHL